VQVDAATRARLGSPTGAGPRSGGPVPRIEVDIARQIVFVVAADSTTTLNTSTGNNDKYKEPRGGGTSVAYTPTGTFQIGRRVDGVETAPLGKLYRPMYFHKGWAIHGSPSVPAYPASHGCVRLSNADQDWLYGRSGGGTQVTLYDTSGKSPKVEPGNAAPGY
jgi:lipoprotein-anchoring transpeptidase ErfK/SrfK